MRLAGEAPEEAKARLAELIDALEQVRGQELARAIETVARGQSLLDPGVTQKVLALVAPGKTNKEIAGELGLSDKTVKNYLSHVFERLSVARRAEAAALFARRHTPGGTH